VYVKPRRIENSTLEAHWSVVRHHPSSFLGNYFLIPSQRPFPLSCDSPQAHRNAARPA
jgi:hypothetical protein